MSKILVYCEHQNKNLKRSSQELLQFAKSQGAEVIGVVFGADSKSVADQAAQNGASLVYTFSDSSMNGYNPELYALAIEEACSKSQATALLASASATGKDLFPKVAAKLNTGIVSDATVLELAGDKVTAKKPLYSAKCFSQNQFQNSGLQIVLMRANQLPVAAADTAKTATTQELSFNKPDLKVLLKEIVKGTSEKLDLTEANIIVSGGRGLKEAANFKVLEDLANVLGATVGASRAVVDAGWVSHSMQVGQTGKTVAPTLYIAVGISGAIQHLAGMTGSKVIVAINNDANAPIFQKSTYGIVGDFADVVPKLTEEFKKVLHK